MYKNLLMLGTLIHVWTFVNKACGIYYLNFSGGADDAKEQKSIMIEPPLFPFVGRRCVKSIRH